MEEDPRSRKLAKKFTAELSDLKLLEGSSAPTSDIERMLRILLDEVDIVDSLCYDETVTGLLRELTLDGKLTHDQLRDISEGVVKVKENSLFTDFLSVLSTFSQGKNEAVISEICNRDEFSKIKDAVDLLKVACHNARKYSDSCIFMSRNGIYDSILFDGLREEGPGQKVIDSIFDSLSKQSDSDDVCKIYSFLSEYDRSDKVLIALSTCLLGTGNPEEASHILATVNFEEFETEDQFLKYIHLCMDARESKYAYRAAKAASSAFPDNIELLYLKGAGLFAVGREDEAVESLEELIKVHPKYEPARIFLGNIYYDRGDFQNMVEITYAVKEKMADNIDWMLKYIHAEINASDLDGAFRDIKTLESKNPDNLDILRIKLDIQVLINDTNDAFVTSRSIFERDRNDRKGRDYYFNELFNRNEYEEFLKRLDEYGSDDEYLNLKVAALLYQNELDDAISFAAKDPEIINYDCVLDAIFFTVRNDTSIVKLIKFIEEDEHILAGIVLRFLQGLKITWNEETMDRVEKSGSLAIAWILARSTINFADRVRPELVNNMLSRPKFNVVNNIIDAIFLIYTGKVSDDMADSMRFAYPLTEALIGTGDFKNASNKLQKAFDPKHSDAFYYYYRSVIDQNLNDINAASRNIEKALEALTNANFYSQQIRIMLSEDEVEGITEAIDTMEKMGAVESLCFTDIYEYVEKKNNPELRDMFLSRFDELGLKNIWIDRMKRDKMADEKDFEGATRVSRVIVVSKLKTPEDIRTHAEILKALSRDEEREEFLESVETETSDPMIDAWLGDSFYLKKDYEKAIEFYNRAVEKGGNPIRIRNFPEALIEAGKYTEAESLIKKIPNSNLLLLKLYHRMGRIMEIASLLETLSLQTKEDEEVIKYIARILWINRQIRDTLIGLFTQSRNIYLGRILVDRMMESRDFIGAEKIMRAIMKEYPEDLDNMLRLGDLLYETKHPTEATSILLKAFKIVENKDDGEQILNTIMKIYFETGNYEEIKKLYSVNTNYVNLANIQWIVRSFIETYDFDMADRIIGYYHGKVLPEDLFSELIDEMNAKKEFLRLQEFASRVFDVEFKVGKVLRTEEIVSMTDIPLKVVEEVYHFIDSEEYYREQDEQRYELLSRDVIKRIARKTSIDNIIYVKINVIFHALPRRDVILAKNLYIYIKKCLRRRRSPMLNDKAVNALLKQALKLGLKREAMDVAYNLNIGVNEAMDIITLMEYVSSLNR